MVRFVQHQDIDFEKWDAAIATSCDSTVLCTSRYLDLLTGGATWHALVVGDYEYVMPLPERKKWGVKYAYTPFFLPQMGVFSKQNIDNQMIGEFIRAIPSGYRQIDLLLNASNDVSELSEKVIALCSHRMSLRDSYDNLFAHYANNTQRNVKSSKKQNLTVSYENVQIAEIINLFLHNRGRERNVHFHMDDYPVLQQVAEQLRNEDRLDVGGVYSAEGKLIAGALFVRDDGCIRFWFSGRDNNFAGSRPMFYLLDDYIHRNAGRPLDFDFNGSTNENVARFYRGFGGVRYEIPMLSYTPQLLWRVLMKTYRKVRQ